MLPHERLCAKPHSDHASFQAARHAAMSAHDGSGNVCGGRRKPLARTLESLRHNDVLVLSCNLSEGEVIRPGAEKVDVVVGRPVFLRKDVVKARSVQQWQRLGYRIRRNEEPCKFVSSCGQRFALFGAWQTEVDPLAVKQPIEGAYADSIVPPPPHGVKRGGTEDIPRQESAQSSARRSRLRRTLPVAVSSFDAHFHELRGWIAWHGHFPWDKSSNCIERRLARWVSKIQMARASGWITREQVAFLESLQGWRWNLGAKVEQEKPYETAKQVSAGFDSQRCDSQMPFLCNDRKQRIPHEDMSAAEQEAAVERWLRITMQRLAADLAKQPNASMRKSRLRQLQLTYHPDKNPGRADEVLPIFRWVQSCWDREFRAADNVSPVEELEQHHTQAKPKRQPRAQQQRREGRHEGRAHKAPNFTGPLARTNIDGVPPSPLGKMARQAGLLAIRRRVRKQCVELQHKSGQHL